MKTSLKSIRVISRDSQLALKQVDEVFAKLPKFKYDLVTIKSFGDKNKEISLLNNDIPDIFTRELDEAIMKGHTEIAIHSAKDLPYPLSEGLEIYALLEAFDKTDSLVSKNNISLANLPKGAKVGTSSQIRKNEITALRPDLEIVSVRGTIEERIAMVDSGIIDALIVATCALKRLGLENRVSEILPFETHPLQGNLAVVGQKGNLELKELFSPFDIRKNYGTVYLTGFGPGDPELLTVKAMKHLTQADVIFYDDLIDHAHLDNYKAEKLYVGKRKGKHSKEQGEINKLLYEAAILGKNIVRLKGGDPMIFAHGGEEIEYLQERLVNVEVIPGISAGIAAASMIKIPLTHREISSSVSFLSGHSDNLVNMPDSGTLVFYMGASNLLAIALEAIQKGWRPTTPVVLIHNVSLPSQTEYYSTLQELSKSQNIYPTPLVVIMGDVVSLKTKKASQVAKPNILVTGTDAHGFSKLGNVVHQPLLDIKPVENIQNIKNTIENLQEYDHVIFTSKFAVQYFFELLDHYNKGINYLSSLTITSIGKVTSEALKDYGIVPHLQPEDESSEGIIELFRKQNIKGKAIFIPRSEIALQILPEGLRELGNIVVTVNIYQNKPSDAKPIDLSGINYIAFSSPSGVDSFMQVYGSVPDNINFIAKGKVTLTRMIEAGFPKDNIKSMNLNEIYPIEYEI